MQFQRIKWFLFFCCCPFVIWGQFPSKLGPFDLFFSYSAADLQAIRSLPILNESLSKEKFEKWDPLLYEITSQLDDPGRKAKRLSAYLYVAQREFALLSYQIAQQWVGNPDLLISNIIHLFYPDIQEKKNIKSDVYSEKIGEIVFRKMEERLKYEEAHLRDYPIKEGPFYWKETLPYIGPQIGSWQPWFISLKNVQAAPPPGPDSIIWIYGIHQILFNQARLTPEQRQLIFYWAGQQGPESGDWLAIVNQAMKKTKDLSFQKFLFIRTLLATGLVDAFIAAFDAKYTYWIRRPHMVDPRIVQIIPIPKHPSYPSAHSVSSAAAATLLSYLLPEEKEKWQALAIESGNTRIWGGLHYMYDNEQGLIQGEKVGRAIVQKIE